MGRNELRPWQRHIIAVLQPGVTITELTALPSTESSSLRRTLSHVLHSLDTSPAACEPRMPTCNGYRVRLGNPATCPLSPRELSIVLLIAEGRTNKEIAHYFGISHQTVKNHMTSVLDRLGADDRTHVAILALSRGWIRIQRPYPKKLYRRRKRGLCRERGPV